MRATPLGQQLLVILILAATTTAQSQDASRRIIEVRQGDTLVVPWDVTVPVVVRTIARVKIVSDEARQRVFVLIDAGRPPDGNVDLYHHFGLQQPYRNDLVWEGDAVVEEFEAIGQRRPPGGLAISTSVGTICFVAARRAEPEFPVDRCSAVFEHTGSGKRTTRGSFAEVEHRVLNGLDEPDGVRMQLEMGVSGVGGFTTAPVRPAGPAPGTVRVGGNIRSPHKTRHVEPVYPDEAQRAGIQGVVILEITINEQGKVGDARVLRSIRGLDQAALDSVRQWEYEPVLLNGVPQRVIMTVVVRFPPEGPG